ncbi:MAG TPA: winged helix-turn-helix domain-containing protein [Candidatus Saccharimonadales bacterium]|nr:winged helix-turn-helix domain-containing protein [Candidatus Saccharimonadales bacterium]
MAGEGLSGDGQAGMPFIFYVEVPGKEGLAGADPDIIGPNGMVRLSDEAAREIAVRRLGAEATDELIVWARPRITVENGQQNVPEADEEEKFEFFGGRLQIYPERHAVYVDGTFRRTSRIRFNMIDLLARNAGQVITHAVFESRIWNGKRVTKNNLWFHINLIRSEILGEDLADALESVRETGFRLNPKFVPTTTTQEDN